VNALDLALVAIALAAAVAGWRLGFTTRVLSWIGLGLGLAAGVRFLPWVLDRMDGASRFQLIAVAMAVVLAGAALGQTVGLALGTRFAPRPRAGLADRVDRSFGAVAGIVGVGALIWLTLPLLAATRGWPGDLTAHSRIARAFATDLPTAPDATKMVETLVGPSQFPAVMGDLDPTAGGTPPPPSAGLAPSVAQSLARSVVKVEGISCQRVLDGSGFVVRPGLVVTNAHVVAGEASTTVIRDDGSRLGATVVAFDPERDLALLSVPRLDRPALTLARPSPGQQGGVFGHPGGDPLRIAPFSLERQITATSNDIYGDHQVTRQVLELAAALAPGDSGSAVVDTTGEVVGVAFAISTDQRNLAYALAPSELDDLLAHPHATAVSTEDCAA
jgi:S1-C subfamily serine protease